MFWNRFTTTTAGVSRYLPPGHSECGFPLIISLCRPKGPANLVGMLNMSHITRRSHGSPHRTGQCSQWSGVRVCLRKRACDISQQSTISKSITRTLDFEESDPLDGLLNGNFCHKSMRGELQRGSVWAKWPTLHILHILEASRSSPSIFLGPSAPLQRRKWYIPSSVAPSILAHHAALWWSSPHRSLCLACQVNHAQSFALPPRVPIEPRAGVVERAHGSDCRPDDPTDGALSGSGGDGRPAP